MTGPLAITGGVVSLSPLEDGSHGALWFHAAMTVVADGRTLPIWFPRLHLAQTEPGEEFRRSCCCRG